jgi:hypothetical protein
MQRRQKTHLGYLLVLEYLEATSCDNIDQAIDAIAKTQRITEAQKQTFKAWYGNDQANFGIGAIYHSIPRAASITVHPVDDNTFQICIRSAERPLLLKLDRRNAVILASEVLAAVQNPSLTRRIHELRPIQPGEANARAIEASRAAVPDAQTMEPISAGRM